MRVCMNEVSLTGSSQRLRRTGRPSKASLLAAVRTLAAIGALAAVGTVAPANVSPARAQSAEQPLPSIAQDRGVRTGEFTLYPSFGVAGHHDTNLFNGNNEENNRPIGATSVRFAPRLSLSNDPNSNIAFSFNGTGDLRLFLSDSAAVTQQDGVGGGIGLNVTFGQRRSFSLTMFNNFNRALRAPNWEINSTLDRISNDVGARVEFHPGDIPERRPLNLALGASWGVDLFDFFPGGDTATIRTKLAGSWRFLPKTAAIIDATWDFRSYANSSLTSQNLAADSQPFRVKVGLNGALTKRLTATALAGWGLSNHAAGAKYNGFLASVGLGLRASESTRVFLGYDHDFSDSFIGNFGGYHRIGFNLKQRFGQVMDVTAQFATRFIEYGAFKPIGGLVKLDGTCDCRRDTGLEGGVNANFDVARLIGMNIGWTMRSVLTNFKVVASDKKTILDSGAFTAHEIFAAVTLRY